jgi:hypothetical protein
VGIEVKDGVIAGDVHMGDVHHHHQHVITQPQVVAQPQYQQTVIVQKSGPSSAAPVIGILCFIFGLINAVLAIPMSDILWQTDGESLAVGIHIFGTIIAMACVMIGGVMIAKYKRSGIYLTWFSMFLMMVFDFLSFEVVEGGEVVRDFYGGSMIHLFNLITSVVCGLLIAIPLFVQNNGLK